MIYLPDVNVWVALAYDRHVHHEPARIWFGSIQQTDSIAFCRITEMGFLRLLTNRKVMAEETLDPKSAWRVYDVMRSDRRVVFLDELPGINANWRQASEGARGGSNMWTDSYLSALATVHHAKLVTFDRPFGKRIGAKVLEG